MAGLIDVAAEAERLGKLLAKTQAELAKTEAKLANENFVRNAPPQVVQTERERAAELARTVAGFSAQPGTRARHARRRERPRPTYRRKRRCSGGARDPRDHHPRQARADPPVSGVPAGARASVDRGCARSRQDDAGARARARAGPGLAARAIHQRPAAGGYHRGLGVRSRQPAFNFRQGPIFTQLLLADEVNRASPRTQSALLEAMEERQVSADVTTYPLPDRFSWSRPRIPTSSSAPSPCRSRSWIAS